MQKKQILGVLTLGWILLAAHPASATPDGRTPSSAFEQRHETLHKGFESLHTPSLEEINQGDILEPGQAGPAVEVIRSLLKELDYPVAPAGEVFDDELAFQLGRFQEQMQLAEPRSEHWGRLGPATLQALQQQAARGRYNWNLGRQIAAFARSQMSGGSHYCYQYVAKAIHAFLPNFLKGMHAYMAAQQLASSRYFREISIPSHELPKLPVGAVVVWEKGKSASGHISIADGKGNEISDHFAPQMTAHYGGGACRVFLPV
ncbi:MAG TPA: peptidoglycan-binding domain-containing protein [Candidatus Obscuribacterales bacterium]